MRFFEIVNGDRIIGASTDCEFWRISNGGTCIDSCDITEAQFISINEKLYHANWMADVREGEFEFDTVTVFEVSEEDYRDILERIENGEIDTDDACSSQPDDSESVSDSDVSIEYQKSAKLIELSQACNHAITKGFDVVLSDGNSHHFSMTTQDQLNLITLSTQVASGIEQIPYHADNEVCKMFSASDISIVIEAATKHKTYHITYYNSLKEYVNSLNCIRDIAGIRYGIEIPEGFKSDILKMIS